VLHCNPYVIYRALRSQATSCINIDAVNIRWREMKDKEMWQKRLALQITVQLPENTQDALAVLAYARAIVEKFLTPDEPQADSVVVPFKPFDAASSR
jgi:hypothetical protein